jgi:hypothetical protein
MTPRAAHVMLRGVAGAARHSTNLQISDKDAE